MPINRTITGSQKWGSVKIARRMGSLKVLSSYSDRGVAQVIAISEVLYFAW